MTWYTRHGDDVSWAQPPYILTFRNFGAVLDGKVAFSEYLIDSLGNCTSYCIVALIDLAYRDRIINTGERERFLSLNCAYQAMGEFI
jgi:hypothetical protein